jgi:hypothetical protein
MMLKIKDNVGISRFLMVTEYMKGNSVVLQQKEIQEIMLNAPDNTFLLIKESLFLDLLL